MSTFSNPTTSSNPPPLSAVMSVVPEYLLRWRRETGADQWDEMWQGVLHMDPPPNVPHQDLEGWLEYYFRRHWVPRTGGRVFHQVAVSPDGEAWTRNYRVPDLLLLLPDRFHLRRPSYLAGPPHVAIEIHSPGDEAHAKLPFYYELGVDEAWIIERDSWRPDLFVRGAAGFEPRAADADGWLRSPLAGAELSMPVSGRLALRLCGDDSTREEFTAT